MSANTHGWVCVSWGPTSGNHVVNVVCLPVEHYLPDALKEASDFLLAGMANDLAAKIAKEDRN